MNPIVQFLHDKLMPDLSEPASLSVPQAILLEHAKDIDAIGELLEKSNQAVFDGNSKPSIVSATKVNDKVDDSHHLSKEDLSARPTN